MATTYTVTPSPSTATEGGQVTFTITRSGDKPAETVYFSTLSDGTATFSEGDYATTTGGAPSNIAVSFSSGTTSRTVTLNILNDGVSDSGEQFRAIVQRNASDPVATFLGRSSFVTINDAAPSTSYSLTASPSTATEGGQVTFTIARSGDKPAETIYFSTLSDGSATYGEGDYATTSGGSPSNIAVSFSSGTTSRTVTLNILSDGVSDTGEQFRAIIQRNSSDPVGTYLDRSSFVTINDAAPSTSYSLTASPSTVTEGGQVTFTITRSGSTPAETVYFSTLSDGTATFGEGDYATTSGASPSNIAVSFSSGATSRTVTLNILNDGVADSGEQFRAIVQRNASDPVADYLDRSGFVTINDAGTQSTTYSLTPASTSVAEGSQLTFTITRSGSMPAETIYFSTLADGTATFAEGDYTTSANGEPLNVPITFAAGAATATVTLNIRNDGVADAGEQFRAIIQRNSSDPVATYLDRSGFVTITETASSTTYSLSPANPSASEGGQLVFTVTRSGDKPAETLYVSTTQTEGFTNSKDYTGLANQALAFASGQTSATLTVATTNDTAPEMRETFGLIVQRDPSSPASVHLVKTTFSIDDNDSSQQPLYSVVANPTPAAEDAGSVTFTITRTGSLGAETLYASTLNGSTSGYATNNGDYATNVKNLPVSFATGQTSKTVTVAIFNDAAGEADETFGFIVQRNPTDAASTYLTKTNWTISDEDGEVTSSYSVSPATRTVGEGAGSLTFTIARSATSSPEIFYISTTQDAGSRNVGDYGTNLDNFSVSFAPGEGSKTVTVAIVNDSIAELDETFGIIVQQNASDAINTYVARATWTIEDDDAGLVTTYAVRPGAGVVPGVANSSLAFTVSRSGDLPEETIYATTVAGVNGYSISENVFASFQGTPVHFAAGATTSSTPVMLSIEGSPSESIANYLLQLLRTSLGTERALAQTTFSISASGPLSPPPPDVPFSVPTLKLPFDSSVTPNVRVTQHFGAGYYDHDGDDNIIDTGDDNHHGYSSGFNPYNFYSVDFGVDVGTPVIAQGTGVVIDFRDSVELGQVGPSDRFGNFVTVRYERPGGGYFFATYMHLQSVTVSKWTEVVTGTKIGLSGNTGGWPTHLHVSYGNDVINGDGDGYPSGGEKLWITDASSPLVKTGSANLLSDPVRFFAGELLEHRSYTVDNAVFKSGPRSTETVTATDSFNKAIVVGNGPAVSVVDATTGKETNHVDNFGDMVFNLLTDLEVKDLGGTYLLFHTIYYNGTPQDDRLEGSETHVSLVAWGGAGVDHLRGGFGPDQLDGGTGADLLAGGPGNDSYLVDDVADAILEIGGEGQDRAYASVSYTLAPGVQVETLSTTDDSGTDPLTLAGNELDNRIIGNAGANTLYGMGGTDRLEGLAGDDSYVVDTALDLVIEAAGQGYDTLFSPVSYVLAAGTEVEVMSTLDRLGTQAIDFTGNEFNNFLYGNAGVNRLAGGGGNDVLDGGAGADAMAGGIGNDVYIVDAAGDSVTELAGEGTDEVQTALAAYALAAEVENLKGLSASGQVLTGNGLDNFIAGGAGGDTLVGGGGNDRLNPGAGADIMRGGLGDDVYAVDNAGDVVEENAGEGTDLVVITLAAYSLFGSQVENLLAATGDTHDLRGSTLNNSITGGAGNDFIRLQDGGTDTANGGGGNDVFLFGGSMTGADAVDGGAGTDQLVLQGDYWGGNALTLGTSFVSVENFAILPGNDTRFGDPGTNFYDYNVTTRDVNVAAGVQLVVDANRLRVGEDLTFNGSAETNGSFFIYGGGGTDLLTGGAMNDVFLFGAQGQWGASDVINGGSAGIDQLALRGNYTLTFGAGQLIGIENIGLLSAHDTRFGALGSSYSYDLTMVDANVAPGVQMTVDGAKLRVAEFFRFDGSQETNGSFRVFGGLVGDTIVGSQSGDFIQGNGGLDTLTGGGGADTFRYLATSDSTTGAVDRILDFTPGSDKIDLTRIDADSFAAGDQAFHWIGSNAFGATGAASAGELRAYQNGGSWFVEGDVNGDGVADLVIELVPQGPTPLGAGDFLP